MGGPPSQSSPKPEACWLATSLATMELSEAGRASAIKFLEKFASEAKLPSCEDPPPAPLPTWWSKEEEAEGICLDAARSYLSKM